ncbi:AMP-binding protein [Lacrimispora saccharolytica]|nr:AMP-binding protein [Lacrimispora saccharolytica]
MPECTVLQYIKNKNTNNLNGIALNYFGNKITYREFFENIDKVAKAFYAIGIRKGDIVTIASMHTPETIYIIYGLNKIGAVANMVYLTLSANEIIENIKSTDSKPRHFVSGPVIVKTMLENNIKDMKFLSTFAGGGESFSIEQEKKVNSFLHDKGYGGNYVTGYGMTECCATVCTGMPGIYKEGTLGIPLPKVNVKIVNPKDGQEQKYDEVGEVCFHASNIMSGYFKNPKETDNIIKTHADNKKWIHTGDLGSVDQEGFLTFHGRIKKIYLTKGSDNNVYKLFPMQIENELIKNEEIFECGTIVVPDQEKIHVAVAFVRVKAGLDEDIVREKI